MATLHDDDTWRSDFLEKTVAPMVEDPQLAMVYTDFWIVDKDGNRRPELTESESARTGRTAAKTGRLDYSRDQGIKLVAVDNAPQPAYAATVRTSAAPSRHLPDRHRAALRRLADIRTDHGEPPALLHQRSTDELSGPRRE